MLTQQVSAKEWVCTVKGFFFVLMFLTISVSDTGPKLVTKMLVLISVTFSVEVRKRERVGLIWDQYHPQNPERFIRHL